MKNEVSLVPNRVLVVVLVWTGCFLVIMLRSNLSVAIIAMVDERRNIGTDSRLNDSELCYEVKYESNNTIDQLAHLRKYAWSQTVQGTILGSYFYGYAATQMLGSLSDKYGAKWIVGVGVTVAALCNALIPVLAEVNYIWIIVLRVIMGIFHGSVLSCSVSLISKWFPRSEQGLALTGVLFFINLGGMVTMPLTGYLCGLQLLDGWPLVFYLTSALHLLWIYFWFKFVYNCPEEDRTISGRELDYILVNNKSSKNTRNLTIPLKRILRSRPVWASIVTKMSGSFGYYLLCAKMPAYLDTVFGLEIQTNSWFNALMYAIVALSSISAGPLSNWIKNKDTISLTTLRKTFQFFGNMSGAVCILLVPLVGCNSELAIALLLIGIYLYCFGFSGGEFAIVNEYAPNYSGTVFGVSNTLASTTGFLGPQFAGFLLDQAKGSGVRQQWNTIWYVTAAIYGIGGLVFVLLSTAKPQPWAIIDEERIDLGRNDNNDRLV